MATDQLATDINGVGSLDELSYDFELKYGNDTVYLMGWGGLPSRCRGEEKHPRGASYPSDVVHSRIRVR